MIINHKTMLMDRVRCRLYQKAIHQMVKPGDVVCDIGTGSGLLAFFAIQAGAKKVYAIEHSDIIEDAKRIAAKNCWQEKIIFIKGISTKVNLPEKVDVIITELIGRFVLEEYLPKYIIDAKRRFLRKGGFLVPSYIEMFLAPVEAPSIYRKQIGCWSRELYGIDYSVTKEEAFNVCCLDMLNPRQLLAKAQKIQSMNFYKINNDRVIHLNKSSRFVIEREGCLHGLAGWFQARLSDKILLSTSPQNRPTHWKNVFFPLKEPLWVKRGDTLKVKLEAKSLFGRIIWSWAVEVSRKIKPNVTDKISFCHSTLKNIYIPKKISLRPFVNPAPRSKERGFTGGGVKK